jgi:hypothetical protein
VHVALPSEEVVQREGERGAQAQHTRHARRARPQVHHLPEELLRVRLLLQRKGLHGAVTQHPYATRVQLDRLRGFGRGHEVSFYAHRRPNGQALHERRVAAANGLIVSGRPDNLQRPWGGSISNLQESNVLLFARRAHPADDRNVNGRRERRHRLVDVRACTLSVG